ncbi:MAG: transposase [Gammaproteobacteria bacterium]
MGIGRINALLPNASKLRNGYNAFWLYPLQIQHNHAFCMRARTNKDLLVKDFTASNKNDAVVTLMPRKTAISICQQKGLPEKPIQLRLISVELDHEVEVLITNLMDADQYSAHIFKSLYHLRWGIEENYKRLKQWVEIENFSGKSALSVQQDFYAKIVATNFTALMALGAQQITAKKTKHLKRNYQINFTQALSKMKHRIVHLVLHAHTDISLLIERTLRYISRTVEAVRKGRSAPRKLKIIKNDIHYPA